MTLKSTKDRTHLAQGKGEGVPENHQKYEKVKNNAIVNNQNKNKKSFNCGTNFSTNARFNVSTFTVVL